MMKMNALIPELIVSDLQQSLRFYCHILGFNIEYDRPEDKFAFLSYGGSQLMLEEDYPDESPWRVGPLERPFGRGLNLSIKCPGSVIAGQVPAGPMFQHGWSVVLAKGTALASVFFGGVD